MVILPPLRKNTPIKDGMVSVVITAYNQPDYIPKAVASVIAQTHQSFEVIVVDDGSTDGITGGVCAALLPTPELQGRLKVIRVKNGGVSRARNWGLSHSDPAAPHVMFLDGDDELLPDALAVLIDALKPAPTAVASLGSACHVDQDGQPIPTDWRCTDFGGRLLTFEDIQADPGICPPGTVLFRKWAVWAAGGFDTTLGAVEDLDFYTRVSLWGPFVGTSGVVCLYRRHTSNTTLDAPLMARGFQDAEIRREFLWRAWERLGS